LDITDRSISKKMEYANNIDAKNVILIGKKEIQEGILTIKNMKTGEEYKKSLNEL